MSITWHLLSGEYPPDCGGVGDYTAALAEALAAGGDEIHVWTPVPAVTGHAGRITVHTLPDAFGPASRRVMESAWSRSPGIALLQYVPNALGSRGANLTFCFWFSRLARRVADVRVMFHEPYFYFTWRRPWTPANGLAAVQRLMAGLLVRGAGRVYYSTATWREYLGGGERAQTLPIPSSIPVADSAAAIAGLRAAALAGAEGRILIGHFGTYGAHVAGELDRLLAPVVAAIAGARLALLGDGARAFLTILSGTHPDVARRAWAPGRLDAASVAAAIKACDLMIQPYPDGITTRRTSAMAGLKNGVATVTTAGTLTEPLWKDSGAVALAPAGDVAAFVDATARLAADADARAAQGRRGAQAYADHFSMEHTIAILRGPAAR